MKLFANMFETWFGRKFYSKCMSNIKITMLRIEMIKRRRKAMEKYLRKDLAELLRNGFDTDAYSRAAGLYLEQRRTLCYEFVEQFCTLILNHLSVMNDQSECPEECREAVPSLMYAAARLADLPELRELRSLFSEKYGNSLESFINKEFVDLLKRDRPTKDMKVRLMQEITSEYGVEWNPKSPERESYRLPWFKHDGSEDVESKRSSHENGWRIKIQETGNNIIDDQSTVATNKEASDIEKQMDHIRERLLNYWSRTTSLLSTSRENSTSTSPGESSPDDSTNKRSFAWLQPPYTKTNPNTSPNKQKHDNNKENEEVSNHSNVKIWDEDNMKNRRRRKGGGLSRPKSHSTECLVDLVAPEAPKGHVRAGSYQANSTVSPPTGHVHPKLPEYDDIIARFAALRAKS